MKYKYKEISRHLFLIMSSSEAGLSHFAPKISDREATGFDYFHEEAGEKNFMRSEFVIIKPLNALGSGPIWCEIGHEESKYLVPLDSIEARMKLQVLDENGDELDQSVDNNASLINFAPESLFENINVKLLKQNVSNSDRLHQFKVALIKNLSYGRAAKKVNLLVERFKTEKNTSATAVDIACGNYTTKAPLVNQSPVFYVNFLPLIDISSGNNWLCLGHQLFLEFERGKDDFVILKKPGTHGKYKIKILDFELQIKKLYPTPAFQQKLEKTLQTRPVVYNFTRNVLKTFQVHSGVKHIEWNNIFTPTQLPNALYFIFLDNNQISGSSAVNPHTWLDYNCSRADLIVNGYAHPADSIRYDKTAKNIFNGYRWFLQNIGIKQSNDDVDIDIEKYYKDKFVIPFDLSHRGDNGFMPQSSETGTLNFRCEFNAATNQALTLLVLASFDNNIVVDKDKNVNMDYV